MKSPRKMERLAVLPLVLLVFGLGVKVFAQSLDDSETKDNQSGVLDELDETSRIAPGQAYVSAGAQGLLRPAPRPARLVECLVCTDCPEAHVNTTTKICPYSSDGSKNNKCVVYSEQYNHMKRPWYIRGCASERGSCAEITRAHSSHSDIVKLHFCQECEGDRCNVNAVSRSFPSPTAFFVLVVIPLFAKHTLS